MNILVINPGSTSTKIAAFNSEECLFQTTVRHPDEDISRFDKVADQYRYRLEAIENTLSQNGRSMSEINAIAARGGLLKPLAGGTYLIDREMVQDLTGCIYGEHASNLAAIIAYNLGKAHGIPAYTTDPVSVDELNCLARYSGLPELPRISQSHALNMRAAAREAASGKGLPLDSINLVVAHLGSGISVAAFERGKMTDVNNPNNEGPFSIERCGGLPSYRLARLCYSGKYTEKQMINMLTRTGGIFGYLGTRDLPAVEKMVLEGDSRAGEVVKSMCYQVSKEIGAMSAALCGHVDGIVLTGGMASSRLVVDEITARISYIAGVMVIPGEKEMEALAKGALRVLNGSEEVKRY
ncbi:MAG: butyrate kinase [Bacillota bacterium]